MAHVLATDYLKENYHSITSNPYNFMVLDVKNLQYREDRERIEHGIGALSYCQSAIWVNQLYAKMGKKEKINIDILFQATQSTMTDKPFSDEELKIYYEAIRNLEEFSFYILKFHEFEPFVTYETEFILLGVPLEEYLSVSKHKLDILMEEYGEIYSAMYSNKLDITKFIEEAKRIAHKLKATI